MEDKKPFVANASNPSQVKEAGDKVKRIRDRELENLRVLLSTPQGKEFVWGVLEFCGIFKDSMTGSSMTFYNEGRRSVGLKVLADVTKASPQAFVQMMMDNEKEK